MSLLVQNRSSFFVGSPFDAGADGTRLGGFLLLLALGRVFLGTQSPRELTFDV
jgi:hypothetical protein